MSATQNKITRYVFGNASGDGSGDIIGLVPENILSRAKIAVLIGGLPYIPYFDSFEFRRVCRTCFKFGAYEGGVYVCELNSNHLRGPDMIFSLKSIPLTTIHFYDRDLHLFSIKTDEFGDFVFSDPLVLCAIPNSQIRVVGPDRNPIYARYMCATITDVDVYKFLIGIVSNRIVWAYDKDGVTFRIVRGKLEKR